MNAIAITGIVCITLVLLIVIPLAIAWSAEKSIKELIFGRYPFGEKEAKIDEKSKV